MMRQILPPSPADMDALQALNIPAPPRQLRKVDIRYLARDKQSLEIFEDHTESRQVFYLPNAITLQCGTSQTVSTATVDYRGLINLGGGGNDSKTHDLISNHNERLRFSGDWAVMPLGQPLKYSYRTVSMVNATDNLIPLDTEETCTVHSQVAASTLHPRLKGQADVVSCEVKNEAGRRVYFSHRLRDYGIALLHMATDGNWENNASIVDVETDETPPVPR